MRGLLTKVKSFFRSDELISDQATIDAVREAERELDDIVAKLKEAKERGSREYPLHWPSQEELKRKPYERRCIKCNRFTTGSAVVKINGYKREEYACIDHIKIVEQEMIWPVDPRDGAW